MIRNWTIVALDVARKIHLFLILLVIWVKEDLFYRQCCIILIDKKNITSAST